MAVCRSGTGGMGGFATAPLAAGRLVIEEAPLLRWEQSAHASTAANLQALLDLLAALAPPARASYFALHRQPPAAFAEQLASLGIDFGDAQAIR